MIPSRFGDVEKLVIDYLTSRLVAVRVSRELEADKTLSQVIVAVEPVGEDTDITARFSVLLEAWAWRANNRTDVGAAKQLMEDALYELQLSKNEVLRVVRTESLMSASTERTSEGDDYIEGSIVLVLARMSA